MKVTFPKKNLILKRCKSKNEIIEWMMKNDYDTSYEKTKENFMKSYAERKALFENITLRHESVESFVSDLVNNNIITIEQ